MSTWATRPLGELTTKIGSGATPRGGAGVYRMTGTSFIRSQNVLDNFMKLDEIARISDEAADALRGVRVETGDVLINITGDSIARCTVVEDSVLPARVSQHVSIVRTTGELDSRYLQRILVNPLFKAHLLSISDGGGTRKALTKADLAALSIPLPPLPEQQAIAEVLGALDDKIAANARLVSVSTKLCAAMLAELRPVVPLENLVTHHKETVDPSEFGESEVAHFSLPAFDAGQFPEIAAPADIKSSKFAVRQPCVLVSKLNPRFPRIWDIQVPPLGLALASTEFLVLESTYSSSSVLWAVLSQPSFSSSLESKVAGTSGSHQRVRPADLLATLVGDPRDLTDSQLSAITAIGKRIALCRTESKSLAVTRDALLPLLMSGKVRVKDAEQQIEGVV